jgi:hypothetical protein
MYAEEVYQKLRTWSEATLFLLRSLLPLVGPVARYEGWSEEERQTLGYLLTASARSSESAMLLTAYGQLWDAEILVRSVFEGSLKLAYILQDKVNFERRYGEYSRALFDIALLKDHAKAEELLKSLPDGDHPSWRPIRDRLLSDEERRDISDCYPQKLRRSLDTKWGFTGILSELASSDDPLFRGFAGMANGYSMASHILHADHVGTSIAMEGDQRSAERRNSKLLAHGARLMSDVMSCLQLRLWVGYRFAGEPYGPLAEANTAMETLRTRFGSVYEDWMVIEYPPVGA